MEAGDTVESTIRGCASFCNQDMDMRMEVDAVSEGLDHGHHSWHELQGCGCVEKSQKCAHCAETERNEELSVVTEEKTQHLRDSKDNLTVRDIQPLYKAISDSDAFWKDINRS